MPIQVQHSPSAATVGTAAFLGGQGDYRKHLENLRKQELELELQDLSQRRNIAFESIQQIRNIQDAQTRQARQLFTSEIQNIRGHQERRRNLHAQIVANERMARFKQLAGLQSAATEFQLDQLRSEQDHQESLAQQQERLELTQELQTGLNEQEQEIRREDLLFKQKMANTEEERELQRKKRERALELRNDIERIRQMNLSPERKQEMINARRLDLNDVMADIMEGANQQEKFNESIVTGPDGKRFYWNGRGYEPYESKEDVQSSVESFKQGVELRQKALEHIQKRAELGGFQTKQQARNFIEGTNELFQLSPPINPTFWEDVLYQPPIEGGAEGGPFRSPPDVPEGAGVDRGPADTMGGMGAESPGYSPDSPRPYKGDDSHVEGEFVVFPNGAVGQYLGDGQYRRVR